MLYLKKEKLAMTLGDAVPFSEKQEGEQEFESTITTPAAFKGWRGAQQKRNNRYSHEEGTGA